jgi:uncharacterized protein YjbI with pentapeptide repeats
MERVSANNSSLNLVLTSSNCVGFESNCSHLDLDISGCSLKRAELNDSILKGAIVNSDLTNLEMNRSDLSALKMSGNAMSGMETEDSSGDLFDNEMEEALNALEEGLDD